MTYKIEDGVPTPPARNRRDLSLLRDSIKALSIGQSFLWDGAGLPPSQIQNRIHTIARDSNARVTTRKIEGGYRVWRIE